MIQTHDFTYRYFGHDYTVMSVSKGGARIEVIGWNRGMSVGDYVLLHGSEPGTLARYRIVRLKYYTDPSDMWSATMDHAPYTGDDDADT